ncbi:hypothetical protein F6X00_12555 [Vibrio vulnificus]|uniref:hypothetical protein n=1 Tax=Vibrio vulnificus TaxID=672 RepID=UPI0015FB0AA9|nr:hypothetical protein [Vibrio vulnificus]MCA0767957.1 hypothetical protein [Vibrio vulnificus]QMV37081.1 hypothetical protein F6X00_12555 [Vibrio vulnificus]HDY7617506.1 hypothetical protein [Vibrio vulnificus]HDY8086360.1 hypothetical protein [Vibrio vulnificus]HDY8169185.1 hypothetical protein [Vibrio vulnificus]
MRQGKILGFSKFNLFGQSLCGFGKSAFAAQILESLKQQNMPKFVMLPHSKLYVFGRGKFFGRKVWKGQVYGKTAFAEISAR